jgi:DNA-binding NarL/FixJ family response regulator
MSELILCGDDLKVLARWKMGLEAAGHDCRTESPAMLMRSPPSHACVIDLGPRGGGDPALLLGVMEALPQVLFVAMAARPTAGQGVALLQAGVRGYGNRLAAPAVVAAMLTSVLDGQVWAGRQVTDHLLALAMARPVTGPAGLSATSIRDRLTAREAEIADDVAAGHSNKVIADERGISERTVKAHLNSIFRKTGIRNRVQLALALSGGEPAVPRRSNA